MTAVNKGEGIAAIVGAGRSPRARRRGSSVRRRSRRRSHGHPESYMHMLPPFLCRLFGHCRSRRRAYLHPDERRWQSYCRHCGTPMRKDALLGWREL